MQIGSLGPTVWRTLILGLSALLATIASTPRASALVVENMTGTTVAPADDPGWDYVSTGGRNFVYLGNGWALSAFHVGLPDLESDPSDVFPEDPDSNDEAIRFNGGTFQRIKNQAYVVKNSGGGLTTDTDLRLIRINGDPGLTPINIASQALTESSAREVTIIGNGRTRLPSQTQWNSNWAEVPSGGSYLGYKTTDPDDNVKRWGTNLIADEDCLFNNCNNDTDLRGTLRMSLGVGMRDVTSMVTQFDANGLTNEAQVVSGDSGSGVFYKRNGAWELIGIVNALYSNYAGQSTLNAAYGNYTTFADLTYYRNDILNIMSSNPNYSVMGDVNLDGIVSGSIVGGVPTGDIAAFVAGWGDDNHDGVGTIETWKKGDLNRDGKTDVADFLMFRPTLGPAGAGSLTLESLLGTAAVPEPTSLILLIAGTGFWAFSRCRLGGLARN